MPLSMLIFVNDEEVNLSITGEKLRQFKQSVYKQQLLY